MAKCKMCETEIQDGKKYCDSCQQKEDARSNESYLDSLLNSVKNTEPNTEAIYSKSQDTSAQDAGSDYTTSEYAGDKRNDGFDLDDFDQISFDEDLSDFDMNDIISDKDLFGYSIPSHDQLRKDGAFIGLPSEDESEAGDSSEETLYNNTEINTEEVTTQEYVSSEDDVTANNDSFSKDDVFSEIAVASTVDTDDEEDFEEGALENKVQGEDLSFDNNEFLNAGNINEEEIESFNQEDNYDVEFNDLLNGLDTFSGDQSIEDNSNDIPDNIDMSGMLNELENNESEKDLDQENESDDLLSLLNQISSDDPVAEDVKAIEELMNSDLVKSKEDGPSDVGEVFSDALKAVSGLNDPNLNEDDILGNLEEEKDKKGKKKKEKKKRKSEKQEEAEADALDEKPKKSWIQRLFGNVKDENAKTNENEDDIFTETPGLERFEDKPKEEKEPKAKKKSKGKKKAESDDSEEGEEGTEKKEKKKKEKKPKEKKPKELMQVIDEIDEDVGRINRMGAAIVFIFFGLLALLLYVGSNTVNYTISIKHASNYFEKQKYTQAYYEVYGVDIKDEDIQLYEKIKTVMFVNKELNSYNNYYMIKEYPQALDSLLKGLKRYDKYIKLADMLGIKTDMNYVRVQILAELKRVFNLSEKQAMSMIKIENMKEYSLKVYDVVLENKDNLQSKGMKKNDSNN